MSSKFLQSGIAWMTPGAGSPSGLQSLALLPFPLRGLGTQGPGTQQCLVLFREPLASVTIFVFWMHEKSVNALRLPLPLFLLSFL